MCPSAAAGLLQSAKHVQVLVCSKNRVKVDAVKRALQTCWPQACFHVEGREAASNVPDQPVGDAETLAGARNRISSLKQHLRLASPLPPSGPPQPPPRPSPAPTPHPSHSRSADDPELLVAIEGGVGPTQCATASTHGNLECFAWVVCEARSGAQSTARTASFNLPPQLASLVKGGMELGHADDKMFGKTNSKSQGGTVGQLSHGIIDRTAYYEHAVVLALLPFLNAELYGAEDHGSLGQAAARTSAAQGGRQ